MKMENKWYPIPNFEDLYEFNPIEKKVKRVDKTVWLKKQKKFKFVAGHLIKPRNYGKLTYSLVKNERTTDIRLSELLRQVFPERTVKSFYSLAGTTDALAQALCQKLDVSINKLKTRFRVGAGCLEMQAVIYTLKKDYNLHESDIAQIVSKNRCTVLYHYNVFEKQLPIYDEHQRLYQLLKPN